MKQGDKDYKGVQFWGERRNLPKIFLYISNFTVLEVYKIKAMTIVIDLSEFVYGGSVYPLETKWQLQGRELLQR